MFSLIITLIAIALVVILVLATMYFGGSAFGRGAAKAAAETLVSQSVQIGAAADLAIAQGRTVALGPRVTFSTELLKSMPVPPQGAYVKGTPAAAHWQYYVPDQTSHFGLQLKVKKEVCMEINKSQGFQGIPAAWDGETKLQCFGPASASADGYTYLYEPPSRTPAQHDLALQKSLNDAKPYASTVRPGYPRECPDGTTIEDGVCDGKAVQPAKAQGFWVVTAVAEQYNRQLFSEGYSPTCPNGAIDLTSASGAASSDEAGEVFSANSVTEMAWNPAPWEGTDLVGPLERTWCIPANPSDVPESVVLSPKPTQAFVDVTSSAVLPASASDYATANQTTYAEASLARVQANGLTWTLLSVEFDVQGANWSTEESPALQGRKLAIAKSAAALETRFDNKLSITLSGVTFSATAGTITFDEPADACVPGTKAAPLGTGGRVVKVLQNGSATSAILKEDGSVWMAGSGRQGAFGNCSVEDSSFWHRVAQGVSNISKGSDKIFLIKADGSLWASGVFLASSAGPNHPGEVDTVKFIQLVPSGVAEAASTGPNNVIFLKKDGTLWLMGADARGYFGTGTVGGQYNSPVQIDSNVRSIQADPLGLAYVKRDNSFWMTGSLLRSHIPGTTPSVTDRENTPGNLPLKLADDVSQGLRSSGMFVMLKTDGTVWAAGGIPGGIGTFGFGLNGPNYLSQFTRLAPELGTLNRIGIHAGGEIEVTAANGITYATGNNWWGTLGDPRGHMQEWKTFLPMAQNVIQSDGEMVRFLLKADGTLWAAGYPVAGEYGIGPTHSVPYGYMLIPY